MKSLTRLILFLIPIGIGGAVLFSIVSSREPPAQKTPQELTRSVRIVKTDKTDFIPAVSGYGVVQPARTWNAVAQVAGRVAYVNPNFKRGAVLKKGTELLRISPEDYKIAIQQAEANIRSAEARLAELKAQEENARRSLDIEKRSLELKQQDLERKKTLLTRGNVAQATVDEEQRALLTQQARVQELENTLQLIPSQRNAQQQEIENNKAQLETAKLNLRRTSIELPFDARIAEASVEETQYVGVGTSLGSADGIAAAEVNVQIPLSQFRNFVSMVAGDTVEASPVVTAEAFRERVESLGLRAVISLKFDELTLNWDGNVVRISDTIDPKTRTVGAIVLVEKPYAQAVPGRKPPLVKGMFVAAEIRAKPLKEQIVVPRSALNGDKIYIAGPDDRLEIRPVKTRVLQDDKAVIESGLSEGDRVVVSDLNPAIPGMLLDPVEDKDLATSLRGGDMAKADTQ